MRNRVPIRFSLSAVALASSLGWLTPVATAQQSAPVAAHAATAATSAQKPPAVSVKDGKLTVRAHEWRLQSLLDEISRQISVAFVDDDAVGSWKISAQCQDLPIDEALRQILTKFDTFFFYGVDDNLPARLKVIWIYPKGRGRGFVPVPPEKWSSTRDLEQRLAAGDPEERAATLEALVERKGAQAMVEIRYGLEDMDEHVRVHTLYAALSAGVELPAETLARALADVSADVRFLALTALADRSDARTIAKRALEDSSPHVQAKAQEILTRLDAAARRQKAEGRSSASDGEKPAEKIPPAGTGTPRAGWILPSPAHHSSTANNVAQAPVTLSTPDTPEMPAGTKQPGQVVPELPREARAEAVAPGRIVPEPPPEARAEAVEQLVENAGPQALGAVLRALGDPDAQVRTRALSAALSGGVELPATTLIQALGDTAPDIRFLALGALASHPDARTFATRAVSDSSRDVQAEARQILNWLEAAARRPPAGLVRRPK